MRWASGFTRRGALALTASAASGLLLAGCGLGGNKGPRSVSGERTGEPVAKVPEFDRIFDPESRIELMGEGFGWAEGPVWSTGDDAFYFVDIVTSALFSVANDRLQVVGLDGARAVVDDSGDPLSNLARLGRKVTGLTESAPGSLLFADQGGASIGHVELATAKVETLFPMEGEPVLSGPNDLILSADRTLYFSDPSEGNPDKKSGVYALELGTRKLRVIDRELEAPNGIALSPKGDALYVSNAWAGRPVVREFSVNGGGEGILRDRIDAGAERPGEKTVLDGMAVDHAGRVFVAGSGNAIYVFEPDGRLLGTLKTGFLASNCAFGGADGSTLFITGAKAGRIRTRTHGLV